MPPTRPAALVAAILACHPVAAAPVEQGPPNVPAFHPAFPEQTRAPASDSGVTLNVERLADGLAHPWGIAILPDGSYLVTERPGTLRVFADGALRPEPVAGVPEVLAEAQGGLLDVAIGPDFATDRMVYLAYSKPLGEGMSVAAAARGRLADDASALEDVTEIFTQEPPTASPLQYGARFVFDGEGHVFIGVGERGRKDPIAQDLAATYGKVVRLNLDGTIPPDNPFAGLDGALGSIWSSGHRNIQGAALRPGTGELWTVEHGPQGGDELNRVERGLNYGWPVTSYGQNYDGTPVGEGITSADGITEPRYYWDPVIAPSGLAFYEGEMFPAWQGDILVGAMRPDGLVRLHLDGDTVVGEERMLEDQGRIRDVEVAPDGAILVITDADNGALLRLTPAAPTD